ncbi:hypothetical protein Hanom_Chr12g01182151 [Helianthus anomalus]
MTLPLCDPRDADVARYNLNGWDVDGSCIMVEHANGVQSMFCTSLWQVAGMIAGQVECIFCFTEIKAGQMWDINSRRQAYGLLKVDCGHK